MSSALLYMYIALLISVISSGIYLIVLFLKKDDIPIDYTIVYNFLSEYTGYWEVIELKVQKGKMRDASIGLPRDVNFVEYFKDKKKVNIEKVKIWYEKHKRLDFPRGMLSPERNISFLLPKHAEDFPPMLKQHPLGKFLMEVTAKADTGKTIESIMRTESDRVTYLAKELGGKESLGEDFFEFIKGKQKDALDATTKEKPSTLPTNNPSHGGYNPPRG